MTYAECLARVGALQRQLGVQQATATPTTAAASSLSGAITAAALGSDTSTFDSLLQGALDSLNQGGSQSAGSSSAAAGSAATTTTPTAGSTASGTTKADGDDLASWATKYVGTPYVAGGRSPSAGWDCAGFTQWVYKSYGLKIPEVSWEQVKLGTKVEGLSQAKAGDLLFFHMPGGHNRDPGPMGINHVGIYLGNGKMVEAANPRKGTVVSTVNAGNLRMVRRIAPVGDGVARTPSQLSAAVTNAARVSAGLGSPDSAAASAAAATASSSGTYVTPSLNKAGQLSGAGLVQVLKHAGFTGEGLRVAWAVAMKESTGEPGQVGPVNGNGTRDHGLFQFNDIHIGKVISADKVYDADANAAAAYKMTKGGTDWGAWGIGNTGWAAHLRTSRPDVYADFQATFRSWYAKFPGA